MFGASSEPASVMEFGFKRLSPRPPWGSFLLVRPHKMSYKQTRKQPTTQKIIGESFSEALEAMHDGPKRCQRYDSSVARRRGDVPCDCDDVVRRTEALSKIRHQRRTSSRRRRMRLRRRRTTLFEARRLTSQPRTVASVAELAVVAAHLRQSRHAVRVTVDSLARMTFTHTHTHTHTHAHTHNRLL